MSGKNSQIAERTMLGGESALSLGSRDRYIIGEYELCMSALELRRLGCAVSISLLAIDVLRFLIVHRERVVSRAELMDSIWSDAHVQDGSITQVIWQIRQAFCDSPKVQRVIRTVRGRGYRFVGEVVVLTQTPDRTCVAS